MSDLVGGKDREILRDLARRALEVASSEPMQRKRELWIGHNGLSQSRIPVLVYPEDAWDELIPLSLCVVEHPLLRAYEWNLRRLLYRAKHINDDFVITSRINVPLVYLSTGWGIAPKRVLSEESRAGMRPADGNSTPFTMAGEFCRVFAGRPSRGAYKIDPALRRIEDVLELPYPRIEPDVEATKQNHALVSDAFGDILDVRINTQVDFNLSLIGTLNSLLGIQPVMMDMIERPEMFHRCMEHMTRGTEGLLEYCEDEGLLELNNEDHFIGSGGIGYTDLLPQPDNRGEVRLMDMWGHATMQSATFISPAMQAEFILPYQTRLLDRFGLNCYGCCERFEEKNLSTVIEMVPRLRRISVSPFTDPHLAADVIGKNYIFSWKPNPSYVQSSEFDLDLNIEHVRSGINAASHLTMEIILKDLLGFHGDPGRLEKWSDAAMHLAAG